LVVSVVLLYACLSPTQITVRLSTDVECTTVTPYGTSIYGGDPKGGPITSTRNCTGPGEMHDIGTLVITPSGDHEEALSLTVVAGVKRPSEECAANDYKDCIVARRRMRFYNHEPLDLPIELRRACLDVPCDPKETCFRGACVTAEVQPVHGCLGPDCTPSAGLGAPDASSTDWELALDRAGKRVRGLAKNGSNLWWTQESATTPAQTEVYVAPVGALPSAVARFRVDDVAYGIAVSPNDDVVYAIQASDRCALLLGSSSGPFTCKNAPGLGVAVLWNPIPTVLVTSTDQAFRITGSTQSTVPAGGGYIESDAKSAWYLARSVILGVDWTSTPPFETFVGANLPRAGPGFAMSTTHWFASTTDGEIYMVNRESTATRSLSLSGGLSEVEDILFDPESSTLYAAGVRGAVSGIFTIRIAPRDLP
jgi:hypothetical protein